MVLRIAEISRKYYSCFNHDLVSMEDATLSAQASWARH
jgi:hypothetical protein